MRTWTARWALGEETIGDFGGGVADSNHRRHKPADLQSAPVGRFGNPPSCTGFKKIPEDILIVKTKIAQRQLQIDKFCLPLLFSEFNFPLLIFYQMPGVKGAKWTDPIQNYARIGIVHFMAYKACLGGEGPIMETLGKNRSRSLFPGR